MTFLVARQRPAFSNDAGMPAYFNFTQIMIRKIFKQIAEAGKDKNFMTFIGGIESLVSKVLSLFMVIVILVAVCDLFRILVNNVFLDPVIFVKKTLFEIFGLFLSILIALELLENITAYLKKHVVQVELVIVTSLIAVARKIILLDLEKVAGFEIIGLAAAVFALSISYWIVRSNKPNSSH